MPFDFPSSPNVGDRTNNSGIWYQWNGTQWTAVATPNNYAPLGAINNVGRNLVHNPVYTIAQRGTGPWTTSGGYTLDRWELAFNLGSSSLTQVSLADAERAQIGDEAARLAIANAFVGAAGGGYNVVVQPIEGVRRLGGKTMTVSFWAVVTAGSATRLGVSLRQNFGTGGTPSPDFVGNGISVAISTVWARYQVTLTLPSTAGMTLGTNGNDYTLLYFWCSAGNTYAAPSGNTGVQSGTVRLWGVQLELGTQATPLDYGGTPQQQLANCQRMYIGNFISTISTWAGNTAGYNYVFTLPVSMRATPTVTATPSGNTNVTTGGISPQNNLAMQMWIQPAAVGIATMTYTSTFSADL